MQQMRDALRAYGSVASGRRRGEQEADVFRRANGALRAARGEARAHQVRAFADNRRLWSAVLNLVYDPASGLPVPLRAAIVSVGLSVQRELALEAPNLEFLIAVNENIAAGLAGQG